MDVDASDAKPPAEDFLPLRLKYEGMLGNSLARSAIECRQQKVGTLYFLGFQMLMVGSPEEGYKLDGCFRA